MSQHQRLADYIDHMMDAARQACAYVNGLSREDFMQDRRTQQAVILNLVIFGGQLPNFWLSTKLLPDSTRRCPGAA